MDRSRTWVGLDLGKAHVITKVGWSPRERHAQRVLLGVFEGSNSPDFLDAVPLYLIPEQGIVKEMSYADVPVSRGFRYVRYVGPNDARCNIAELEFYGYEGAGDDSRWYQVTNLPTVSIHTYAGTDPQDKVTEMPSNITITYDGGTRIQEYPITARGRGNASWNFPKKPLRIKYDIAVLKIEGKGMPAVSVGDSDTLKVGEQVVAIGNPLGELTFTMTNGILSAIDRDINIDGNPQNMLQTNAAINSGNSGGPLFDMDGNVIGVTTAKYSGSSMTGTSIEGLGFAIPINEALKVAYDLAEYGYVKGQAYLGVTVKTLDSQTADYYGLPMGPRVESVTPGSCADKAGIQVGDIIIRFNGEDVENNSALIAALKRVKAGDTVNATLVRLGGEMEVTITLDEKPSQDVLDALLEEEQSKQNSQEEYYYQFPEGFGN